MHFGRLAARTLIGGLFIGHGTQKLFGWFGGPGREGTEGMMTALGMHPPKQQALLAGVGETLGGSLVLTGLATPVGTSLITAAMTTAIRKVHLANGPWVSKGGWEYNAVLIGALAALVETGPGDLSLDHALGIERKGAGWSVASVLLGVAAGFAAMTAGGRLAPPSGGEGDPASGPAGGPAAAAESGTAGDPTTKDA
jgi:putative oxidoreductase